MRRRRSHPAGALLLEAVVALAVLVGFGGVILATLSDAREQLDVARRRVLAQDLATSAIAELSAGLRQAEEMSGPVRESTDRGGSGAAVEDAPREAGAWELAVETTPGAYEGLTLVSVTAREAGRANGVSFTLRRLVAARVGPNSSGRVSGADEGVSR
jgi:hypothetical protein